MKTNIGDLIMSNPASNGLWRKEVSASLGNYELHLIPENQLYKLQCLLEDVFLQNEHVPAWVLNLHDALITHWESFENDNAGIQE